MKFLSTALLISAFLFTDIGCGWAQEQLLPSIKRIVDRGEIIVATLDKSAAPMVMIDDKNKLTGFDINLARLVGKRLGVKVAFRRAPSFDDVVGLVAKLEADIGVSFLSQTTDRARTVLFTRPYVSQSVTALINRVRGLRLGNSCPSGDELGRLAETPKLAGVIRDSSHAAGVKIRFPKAKPVAFATLEKMLGAVASGKIMFSIQGEIGAQYFMGQNPAAFIRLKLCKIGRIKDRIGIAVRPDSPGLLAWLDVLLDNYGIRLQAEEMDDSHFEFPFR